MLNREDFLDVLKQHVRCGYNVFDVRVHGELIDFMHVEKETVYLVNFGRRVNIPENPYYQSLIVLWDTEHTGWDDNDVILSGREFCDIFDIDYESIKKVLERVPK